MFGAARFPKRQKEQSLEIFKRKCIIEQSIQVYFKLASYMFPLQSKMKILYISTVRIDR